MKKENKNTIEEIDEQDEQDELLIQKEKVYESSYGWIKNMKLVRIGKCDYKKCGSACCRFYSINKNESMDGYTAGFFPTKDKFGNFVLNKNCSHLSTDGKCMVWGTDEFPEVCKQFPHPTDSVYVNVFEECGFRFELQPDGEE